VVRGDVHYLTAPGCAALSLPRAFPCVILRICCIPFVLPLLIWMGRISLVFLSQYSLAIVLVIGIAIPLPLSPTLSLFGGHLAPGDFDA
jgi:hypothetical protein